jgi:hypothetical protein
MSERDRRRLSSRISLLERVTSMRREEGQSDPPARLGPEDDEGRLERLEARVQHLEVALEGFQDSVHRDATRYDDLIAELQRRTHPAALAQAISAHSRARGL